MDEIWPTLKTDIDPHQLYETDRYDFIHKNLGLAWLTLNMISSVNGASTISGLSGDLGSKGDRLIFHSLRASADFILAGANTVRLEKYGRPEISQEIQERRLKRGQARLPRLVTITSSLKFEEDTKFLNDNEPEFLPIIYTTRNAPPENKEKLSVRAEIREADTDEIDFPKIVEDLGEQGKIILVEGGPMLNGQLFQADLIDELCLTISPVIVGEDAQQMINGQLEQPKDMKLASVLTDEDNMLYLRLLKQ